MQGWMIALIIVACVVAALAVAFLVGSLAAVHIILGRRKTPVPQANTVNDPSRYGINNAWFDGVADLTETVDLTAYDGVELTASLIKQKDTALRVAVCCHGYGATQRSMQVQAKLFYDRGFDVLLPSMRGHGKSGGKVGMACT
ncbi:MAG: alpha/beta hydrolase, partial [Clostridiales bacterium]|nr:alpha/beta hydrolase [Clostridiales bacterium]